MQPYRSAAHTYSGNALDLIKQVRPASVHLVITDPPYFIDGMGDDWDRQALNDKAVKAGVVGSLPVGMKFDPAQGRRFQAFMRDISDEVMRVLKPGGFFIAFTQARLYHRLAIAAEDAGFEIRDMMGWTYEGQAKAFSQDHFIRKMKISDAEKEAMIASLGGRKTPQLKPQIEPMILAQKPRDGTFVENWLTHETGLVDVNQSLDGKFPGQLMKVAKPGKAEKGEFNDHLTVKPVRLIEHLIRLFSAEGQVVLDPFLGSGSHGVAARRVGRRFIGFEIDCHHASIAHRRLAKVVTNPESNVIDLWRPFKQPTQKPVLT